MSIALYLPPDPSICDLFKAASFDTWERIKFARTTPGLKIFETTITQNIVYEFNLLKVRYPRWGLQLFEATNERANGNDLELVIRHNSGVCYKYVIQAKIIYHYPRRWGFNDGNYPAMKHGEEGNYQIDLLINYARNNGSIPLFLMYNYISPEILLPRLHLNNNPKSLGCSIISAYSLKRNFVTDTGQLQGNITFHQLHPHLNRLHYVPPIRYQYAFPWELLTCRYRNFPDQLLVYLMNIPPDHILTSYPDINLLQSSDWQEMRNVETGSIRDLREDFINSETDNFSSKLSPVQSHEISFQPKFRIVISQE